VAVGREKMSTSQTQWQRRYSINLDSEDGRIGELAHSASATRLFPPPASTSKTGVLIGEPNVEVLAIEIDVDYTRNNVENDVFDT
jgi:hypothetical protein